METPFSLIIFIVIILLLALVVMWSRRRASGSSSGSGSMVAPVAPAQTRSPRQNRAETGSYDAVPADDEYAAQEQSKSSRAKPPAVEAPPPPPPIVQPAPVTPAPQPAPAKPAPRRSAEGLFDEEREEATLSEKTRDIDDKPDTAAEPEPVQDGLAAPGGGFTPPPINQPTPAIPREEEKIADAKSEAAPIPTEDVRFTAYHPKEADVETWYTLLVYAHIEAALAKVQADAAKYKAEMGDTPRESRSSAGAQLARGTELTLVPQMEGVEFNPERVSFKWVEDMHRAEFRMKAGKDLAGLAGNGTISIFVGPLIVATIRFGMLFNEKSNIVTDRMAMTATPPTATSAPMESSTATLYKADQIFVSYSHKDSPVVLACRDAYKALGYGVLLDIDTLRSGEKWNDALMRMIDRADIFQLFWSKNSADSKYCKQEWEYALKKSKEGFIRPVYWELPLVTPPDDLDELHFAFVPLPKKDQ